VEFDAFDAKIVQILGYKVPVILGGENVFVRTGTEVIGPFHCGRQRDFYLVGLYI